ncbi:MAG: hypothetical protein E7Z96_01265 [Actinomycetaceae bacterium]|nr:hypothetical protein [Actinomycetaceae bacterium]
MNILLCLHSELESSVLRVLEGCKPPVVVVRRCADGAEVLASAQAGLAELAVVDEADRTLVAELHACGVRVVAVPRDPAAQWARNTRCDAVAPPIAETVVEAITAFRDAPPPASDRTISRHSQEEGRLIAVWGTPGAPGRSTVARDLAHVLGAGASTVLIDADTRSPCLAQLLGCSEETSAIVAVARRFNHGERIATAVGDNVEHVASFAFLAGLNTGARWRELPVAVVDDLWKHVKQSWPMAVVDCAAECEHDELEYGMERDAVTLSLLAAATAVLCVSSFDPLGIRRLLRQLDVADELGVQRPHVVLTGARSSRGRAVDRRQIEELLAGRGFDSVSWLRCDREHLEQAVMRGVTHDEIAPQCGLSHDMRNLAETVTGAPLPVRRRFWRRRQHQHAAAGKEEALASEATSSRVSLRAVVQASATAQGVDRMGM